DDIRVRHSVSTDYYECNLTLSNSTQEVYNWVHKKGYKINFLINNAGFGGVGSFDSYSFEYVNRMIDLNIKSVTQLTHLFMSDLKANAPANLLNVSSMAANFPFPYKSIYAASKVYVKNFSLALSEELKPFQVSVSILQPGAVPTNEVVKNQLRTGGFLARLSSVSPENVAHTAISGALSGQRVITPGYKNRISLFLMKLIPTVISLPLLAKQGRKMMAKKTK
ncbi:MAG: short-subunit dehydrogenase, partial [Dokdonia sp.]